MAVQSTVCILGSLIGNAFFLKPDATRVVNASHLICRLLFCFLHYFVVDNLLSLCFYLRSFLSLLLPLDATIEDKCCNCTQKKASCVFWENYYAYREIALNVKRNNKEKFS